MLTNFILDNKIDGSCDKNAKVLSGAEIEQKIRIQKNKEGLLQQENIYKAKLAILEEESNYWKVMNQNVSIKQDVYAAELKAMGAQQSYWERRRDAYNSDLVHENET